MVLNRFLVGNFQASILLTDGGDVVLANGKGGLGSGFRVGVGDSMIVSIGLVDLVVTNFCSYGDSVGSGVGSGFAAQNMHRRRSLFQYRFNGMDRRGSSSLFIRAAGSAQTAS